MSYELTLTFNPRSASNFNLDAEFLRTLIPMSPERADATINLIRFSGRATITLSHAEATAYRRNRHLHWQDQFQYGFQHHTMI